MGSSGGRGDVRRACSPPRRTDSPPAAAPEDADRMDITTVNDRHLYRGRVVVQDPADPARALELPGRVIRFGPAGWLTVVAAFGDDAEIEVYPTDRVLAITDLQEAGAPG